MEEKAGLVSKIKNVPSESKIVTIFCDYQVLFTKLLKCDALVTSMQIKLWPLSYSG